MILNKVGLGPARGSCCGRRWSGRACRCWACCGGPRRWTCPRGTSAWCRSPSGGPRRVEAVRGAGGAGGRRVRPGRGARAGARGGARAGCGVGRGGGRGGRPARGVRGAAAAVRPVVAVAGGPRVHLLLRRARRAARRRRRARSCLRPAARRAPARRAPPGWSSAAASPRCTPPSCPPTRRCARPWPRWPERRSGRRGVRRAAVPVPGARRPADVRRAGRHRAR